MCVIVVTYDDEFITIPFQESLVHKLLNLVKTVYYSRYSNQQTRIGTISFISLFPTRILKFNDRIRDVYTGLLRIRTESNMGIEDIGTRTLKTCDLGLRVGRSVT